MIPIHVYFARAPIVAALTAIVWMAGCVGTDAAGPLGPGDGPPITGVNLALSLLGPDSVFAGQRPTMTWSATASARQGSVVLAPTIGVQARARTNLGGFFSFPVFFFQEPGASEVSGTFVAPVGPTAGDTLVVTLVVSATFAGVGADAGIERSAEARVPAARGPDSAAAKPVPDPARDGTTR